ncbi:MAG: hypothetical protein ACHQ5A_06115, partial [Opitutales bacterium]
MNKRRLRPWGAALVALCAAGGAVGPDYHRPAVAAPAAWQAAAPAAGFNPADTTRWWRNFRDPELTALVESALKQNL